ncbi:MAG TPA: FHA domain-containing protein [Steroidobacteraceae bacterium]|jgi:chromosome segregation ATPase|nr:FHA domain-containing protein [Steroidobacteraceae bacterium]
MATEHIQSPEPDLERTDRLPIIQGASFDDDVADDAVRMDHTAVMAGLPQVIAGTALAEFGRPSGVDLPSLAESVRSVEERITRQAAEYEALSRSYEKARDAEAAAAERANALAVDLAAARTSLEAEQARTREMDRTLAERSTTVDAARVRVEDALRESERFQGETKTLRDSLADREAAIQKVLHSLGERDAQLSALQREHASIVPRLEDSAKSGTQLAEELKAARGRITALNAELKGAQDNASMLAAKLEHGETEINVTRAELGSSKMQASSYLELLSTREWRLGFDQNLFREMDARVGEATDGYGAVESERNRLRDELTTLESKLATHTVAAEGERKRLAAALAAQEQALKEATAKLGEQTASAAELKAQAERNQLEHASQMNELRGQHAAHLEKVLGERTAQVEKLHNERSAQVEQMRADHAAQTARLESEAETREQEAAVLMAHLKEARRPIEVIEAEVTHLKTQLAERTAEHAALAEDHAKIKATLERTRGALEEREFLIRRLERSESNNANVLGRIQTSIERLGGSPLQVHTTAPPAGEWSAELIRIDGERPETYTLSRRTRIGRATGCELQIDSTSVSRHHALVLVGPREAIIEDLNSTNGVIVNGRKISKTLLNDGDAVTIGEIQFRYIARPAQPAPIPHPEPAAPEAPAD